MWIVDIDDSTRGSHCINVVRIGIICCRRGAVGYRCYDFVVLDLALVYVAGVGWRRIVAVESHAHTVFLTCGGGWYGETARDG